MQEPSIVEMDMNQIPVLRLAVRNSGTTDIYNYVTNTFVKEIENIRKNGFVRIRADGEIFDLSENINLEKNKKHNIEIIIDRLIISKDLRSRLAESIEAATNFSDGLVIINVDGGEDFLFSKNFSCPEHDISFESLEPRMFSFNSPFGACKKCTGLGVFMKIDPELIIPDKTKSIKSGGIKGSGWSMEGNSIANMYFEALAKNIIFHSALRFVSSQKKLLILFYTVQKAK